MTTSTIAILLMSTLGCLGASAGIFVLMRANRRKEQLLTELQNTLERSTPPCQDNNTEDALFGDNLRTAALTTRLQQPRLAVQQTCHANTPERYSYIKSLVAKGMDAQEIAALLSMSIHETTQIITLLNVAQPQLKEMAKNAEPARVTCGGGEPETGAPSAQLACNTREHQPSATLQTNDEHIPGNSIKPRTRSMKLARWMRNRTFSTSPSRAKTGRHPPPVILHPHGERGRPLSPLPGYS